MQVIEEEKFRNQRKPVYGLINLDNMNENAKDYYFAIYSLYMDLLYKYLVKNTSISKYDKMLKEKSYITVNENQKNFYQKFANDYFQYYYIRNNLYLDRLTEEEIKYLGNKLLEDEPIFDKKCEEFIKNTLLKVLFVDVSGKMDPNYNVFYESNNIGYVANCMSLVIASSVETPPTDETFSFEEYTHRVRQLHIIDKELKQELSNELNMNTAVFYYEIGNMDPELKL